MSAFSIFFTGRRAALTGRKCVALAAVLLSIAYLACYQTVTPAHADPACTITGTSGNDTITGTEGPDVICAGDGDDVVDGGNGNDIIYAGAGADVVYGGAGNDTVYGGDGDDQLAGEAGDDTLYGEYGIDQLSGDSGADTLDGGADNDALQGGDDNDILHGGFGTDTLSGDAGNDRLYGENDNDWLSGGAGDDYLDGSFGTDSLYGGNGNDQITGGPDSDTLRGDVGNDALQGDFGNDDLDGGPGSDTLDGGNDGDTCVAETSAAALTSCESLVNNTSPDVVASYATSSSPVPLPNSPVAGNGGSYTSNVDGVQTTIPTSSQGTVALSSSANSVAVSVPQATSPVPAVVSRDQSVVYDAPGAATDVTAQVIDGGVRLTTVQQSSTSSPNTTYALAIPSGSTLTSESDGAISVKNSAGDFVAGISAPWAQDANGVLLPTHYTVTGTSVTQVVDTSGAGVTYPVTSDPYFGIKLISSVNRINGPSGTTWQVFPTLYGRFAAAWIHDVFGWNEVKAKGVPNWSKLHDQYVCHPLTQVARVKSSWNLDSWRPDVGLTRTLWARCNPT